MAKGGLKFAVLAAALAMLATIGAPSASAAQEIGNRCVANDEEADWTVIGLSNNLPQTTLADLAPPEHASVITRWKSELEPGTGPVQQQLLAFQAGGELSYRLVGESAIETLVDGVNEFPTRVPIPEYGRIGLRGPSETLFCDKETGQFAGLVEGHWTVGETRPYKDLKGTGVPAIAFLEPDFDSDGYGDLTQDQCNGMPAFHEGCPAIAVTAGKAKVGKLAISVPLSVASPTPLSVAAQARITGQVALGKGAKPVFLSNYGFQNLVPGSPLTIDVPLPKPVRKRLDRLGRKASLKTTLSVGLDNAAAFAQPAPTELTVKLPGRKKPRHRKH